MDIDSNISDDLDNDAPRVIRMKIEENESGSYEAELAQATNLGDTMKIELTEGETADNTTATSTSGPTEDALDISKTSGKRPRGRPPLSSRSRAPSSEFETAQSPVEPIKTITLPQPPVATSTTSNAKLKPLSISESAQRVLSCLMTENPLTPEGLKILIPDTSIDNIYSVLEVFVVMGIVVQLQVARKDQVAPSSSTTSSTANVIPTLDTGRDVVYLTKPTTTAPATTAVNPIPTEFIPWKDVFSGYTMKPLVASFPPQNIVNNTNNNPNNNNVTIPLNQVKANQHKGKGEVYYTIAGHARGPEAVDLRKVVEVIEEKKRNIDVIQTRISKIQDLMSTLQNVTAPTSDIETIRKKHLKRFIIKSMEDSESLSIEGDPLYAAVADACGVKIPYCR